MDGPSNCLSVERVAPASVFVPRTPLLLQFFQKVDRPRIQRGIAARLRQKGKSHRVVRVRNRETKSRRKKAPCRRDERLRENHGRDSDGAHQPITVVKAFCPAAKWTGEVGLIIPRGLAVLLKPSHELVQYQLNSGQGNLAHVRDSGHLDTLFSLRKDSKIIDSLQVDKSSQNRLQFFHLLLAMKTHQLYRSRRNSSPPDASCAASQQSPFA